MPNLLDNTLKLIFLLFGTVFFIGGFVLLWGVLRTRKKINLSRSWPETTGKVISAVVNKEHFRSGDSFIPEINYRYSVLDQNFNGKFILDNHKSNEEALKIIAPYKVGSDVPIHYNPQKPQEHVSEQDQLSNKYLLVIAGMLIFGMLSLWMAFFS
jgi:hypothetical protein